MVNWDPSGKLAVVTGASSGIGAATARALARRGFRVVAAARRTDRLADLESDDSRLIAHELDVTDPASTAAIPAAMMMRTGSPTNSWYVRASYDSTR